MLLKLKCVFYQMSSPTKQPRPQGAFPWPKPGKAPWGRGWPTKNIHVLENRIRDILTNLELLLCDFCPVIITPNNFPLQGGMGTSGID